MITDKTYKEKFEIVEPWGDEIIQAVRKEIKSEHLPKESALIQKYFTKKSIDKITPEELAQAYLKEIREGNEALGEWVCSRWMLRNGEIYYFFVERLQEIGPEVEQIENIPDAKSVRWMEEAIDAFGAKMAYLFSVINCVSFSPEVFSEFRERVEEEERKQKEMLEEESPKESIEELKQRHAEEIAKLTEKYEKKLLGFQKKYTQDIDALKKQAAALQRKLSS